MGCAVAVGGLLALSELFGTGTDSRTVLSTLGIAIVVSTAIPLLGALDALCGDHGAQGWLEHAVLIGMLGCTAMLLVIARRMDGAPVFATCLVMSLVFGAAVEFLRRRMRARRLAALAVAGYSAQLAESYGWRA